MFLSFLYRHMHRFSPPLFLLSSCHYRAASVWNTPTCIGHKMAQFLHILVNIISELFMMCKSVFVRVASAASESAICFCCFQHRGRRFPSEEEDVFSQTPWKRSGRWGCWGRGRPVADGQRRAVAPTGRGCGGDPDWRVCVCFLDHVCLSSHLTWNTTPDPERETGNRLSCSFWTFAHIEVISP